MKLVHSGMLMLNVEGNCFAVFLKSGTAPKLTAGTVMELKLNECVVAFESGVFEVGAELPLRAEWRNKFHQQFARVLDVQTQSARPIVKFQRLGEPVNCESRSLFRINVVLQGIKCKVDNDRDCQLADVSVEGISAIVRRPLKLGAIVSIDVTVDDRNATGSVRVLSEKALPNGTFRYGMIVPEKNSPLRRSLEVISGNLQRKQLRRLVGAA